MSTVRLRRHRSEHGQRGPHTPEVQRQEETLWTCHLALDKALSPASDSIENGFSGSSNKHITIYYASV